MMSRYWTLGTGVRLTHTPTGESVTLYSGNFSRARRPNHAELLEAARSLLAAKIRARGLPGGPTRTYTLHPEWAASVRQGGRTLASGPSVAGLLGDGTGLDGVMARARRA